MTKRNLPSGAKAIKPGMEGAPPVIAAGIAIDPTTLFVELSIMTTELEPGTLV
jgi:hypothetical protein